MTGFLFLSRINKNGFQKERRIFNLSDSVDCSLTPLFYCCKLRLSKHSFTLKGSQNRCHNYKFPFCKILTVMSTDILWIDRTLQSKSLPSALVKSHGFEDKICKFSKVGNLFKVSPCKRLNCTLCFPWVLSESKPYCWKYLRLTPYNPIHLRKYGLA